MQNWNKQKLFIRIVKLVKRYTVWSLRVTSFFFLCHFQVRVLFSFFFFFFSLSQEVTRVNYICKDILGVGGQVAPLWLHPWLRVNKYSSSQCVKCFNTQPMPMAALHYSKVFTVTPWLEKTKFQKIEFIKNKNNVTFTIFSQ